MQENKPTHHKLTILAISISLLALVIIWNPFNLGVSNDPDVQGATSTIEPPDQSVHEIVITDNNGVSSTFIMEHVGGESAYDTLIRTDYDFDELTLEFEEYEFDGVSSYFLTTINGYTPDTNVAYWEFQVNGEPSFTGLADYMMQPGDDISFNVVEL